MCALRACAVALAACVVTGCGGQSTIVESPLPERPSRVTASSRPLELSVRLPDGTWIHVGDLRGRPTLVVFLATYDAVSQALLRPLDRIARERPDLAIVGVLAQAEASDLADAFVHAAHPAFPIGWDPDGRVLAGRTAVGRIPAVPLTVALDRDGREVQRIVGYASEHDLAQMIERAEARVPARPDTPPPLLGSDTARESRHEGAPSP